MKAVYGGEDPDLSSDINSSHVDLDLEDHPIFRMQRPEPRPSALRDAWFADHDQDWMVDPRDIKVFVNAEKKKIRKANKAARLSKGREQPAAARSSAQPNAPPPVPPFGGAGYASGFGATDYGPPGFDPPRFVPPAYGTLGAPGTLPPDYFGSIRGNPDLGPPAAIAASIWPTPADAVAGASVASTPAVVQAPAAGEMGTAAANLVEAANNLVKAANSLAGVANNLAEAAKNRAGGGNATKLV